MADQHETSQRVLIGNASAPIQIIGPLLIEAQIKAWARRVARS
jgi:hypothetical protein